MKSLVFKGINCRIAATQQEYNTLFAKKDENGELLMIFELTDEEIAEITRTKKLVYRRLTFGHKFQPFAILTEWPGDEPPEILPDTNKDPKLN